MQQQRLDYLEVAANQLTQDGMRELAEAGYGIAYQSVHNRDIYLCVRVAPQETLPAVPPKAEEESSSNGRDGDNGRTYTRDEIRAAVVREDLSPQEVHDAAVYAANAAAYAAMERQGRASPPRDD